MYKGTEYPYIYLSMQRVTAGKKQSKNYDKMVILGTDIYPVLSEK